MLPSATSLCRSKECYKVQSFLYLLVSPQNLHGRAISIHYHSSSASEGKMLKDLNKGSGSGGGTIKRKRRLPIDLATKNNFALSDAYKHLTTKPTTLYARFIDSLAYKYSLAKTDVIVKYPQDAASDEQVLADCAQFGEVNTINWIPSLDRPQKGPYCAIVSFSNASAASEMMSMLQSSSGPFGNVSPRVCKAVTTNKVISAAGVSDKHLKSVHKRLYPPTKLDITARLKTCGQLHEYIEQLANLRRMDSLQERINYIHCCVLDESLCRLFPQVKTLPHGSSVCGIASKGSDLDMIGHLLGTSNWDSASHNSSNKTTFLPQLDIAVERLNSAPNTTRCLADYIRLNIPMFYKVVDLSRASVPIVKFCSALCDTKCDFQQTLDRVNPSLQSSFMLKQMARHDARFPVLVQTLKCWSKANGLTLEHPGGHLINFSLAHLVLFYMQQQQLLPPANLVYSPPANGKMRRPNTKPDMSELGDLYVDFFRYWSKFDYKQIIDVYTGTHYTDNSGTSDCLYIRDSVLLNVNIAKRTRPPYLQSFVDQCTLMCDLFKSPCGRDNRDMFIKQHTS